MPPKRKRQEDSQEVKHEPGPEAKHEPAPTPAPVPGPAPDQEIVQAVVPDAADAALGPEDIVSHGDDWVALKLDTGEDLYIEAHKLDCCSGYFARLIDNPMTRNSRWSFALTEAEHAADEWNVSLFLAWANLRHPGFAGEEVAVIFGHDRGFGPGPDNNQWARWHLEGDRGRHVACKLTKARVLATKLEAPEFADQITAMLWYALHFGRHGGGGGDMMLGLGLSPMEHPLICMDCYLPRLSAADGHGLVAMLVDTFARAVERHGPEGLDQALFRLPLDYHAWTLARIVDSWGESLTARWDNARADDAVVHAENLQAYITLMRAVIHVLMGPR